MPNVKWWGYDLLTGQRVSGVVFVPSEHDAVKPFWSRFWRAMRRLLGAR